MVPLVAELAAQSGDDRVNAASISDADIVVDRGSYEQSRRISGFIRENAVGTNGNCFLCACGSN